MGPPSVHRVARHERLLRRRRQRPVAPDVEVPVLHVVRMERHAVGDSVDLEELLGLLDAGRVLDPQNAARAAPRKGLVDEEQRIGPGFACHGDRAGDFEVGKRRADPEGERRVGRADDARRRQRRAPVDRRPLEAQRRIVLVLVEAGLRQRRAGGELGAFEVRGVVVAAEREGPLFVDLGPASRADEVAPGEAALHGPALVLILPVVERAVELHGGLEVEVGVVAEAVEAAAAATGEEELEGGAGGVDLELVVSRLPGGGLEEELEDVVFPELAVVFLDRGEEVAVLHLRQEVEVLAIPEQLRGRAGLRGPGVCPQPGKIEVVDRLGILPRGVVAAAVEGGSRLGPAALEGDRAGGGGDARRRRLAGSGGEHQDGQGEGSIDETIHVVPVHLRLTIVRCLGAKI